MIDRLNRRPRGIRRAMLAVGCSAVMLSGCVVTRSEDGAAESTESTVKQDSTDNDASTDPPVSGGETSATTAADDDPSSESTAPSPDSATTVPETSRPDDPAGPSTTIALPRDCDEFADATAYARMIVVENGDAPDGEACADAVAAATAANRVFQKGRKLSRDYGIGDWQSNVSTLFPGLACEGTSTRSDVVNTFDAPIVVWGAAYVINATGGNDFEVLDSQLFVSAVLTPGETVSLGLELDRSGAEDSICYFDTRVLLAPTGDFAADAGLDAAASGDPQTSDDPAVWFGALREVEDGFAANPSPEILISNIEDVHSPDVWTVLGGRPDGSETGPLDPEGVVLRRVSVTTPDSTTNVCSIDDVTDGRDSSGELALMVFTSATSVRGPSQALGLFRRGGDGRWRYVGRTVELPTTPDRGDLCDGAPTLAT